jgi:hypothetical protein
MAIRKDLNVRAGSHFWLFRLLFFPGHQFGATGHDIMHCPVSHIIIIRQLLT